MTKLRVWNNVDGVTSYTDISDKYEAKRFIRGLIEEQKDDDSITMNAFGLEEEGENGEWSEWSNRDGEDIMEIIDNEDMEEEAKVNMSDNQKLFVSDAEEQGFNVDYSYSGRGMYGKTCPSIIQERGGDRFGTKARTQEDSMGMDTVIYAQY